MDDFTFGLLGVFSCLAYLATVLFIWAVYKENRCAENKALLAESVFSGGMADGHRSIHPGFGKFLRAQWKPLALFGLIYLGAFGFFITHVCQYD